MENYIHPFMNNIGIYIIVKTWNSISECAKELNLNISGISKVLKGRIKTTKGYKFKYE